MRWLRIIRNWLRGDRLSREIDDELAFHLEMRERELIEQGLTIEQARRAARRRFGNGTLVKEDSRAVWAVAWLETLWQDLRYGNRTLMKSPGFTVVAVLTLALGIGASTVVFSIVNGVLLHPLGSVDHDGLVFVYSKSDRRYQFYPAWGDYSDWEKQTQTLQSMGGWRLQRFVMASEDDSEQVTLFRVTPDLFSTLGLRAALGRTFLAEDFEAGSPAVTVLTHAWWRHHLGGDPEAVGRTLTFREGTYTIVGVLPDTEFQLSAHNKPEIFAPMRLTPAERRTRWSFWFGCVARLKPEFTIEQAQAEFDVIAERIAQEYPDNNRGSWGMHLTPEAPRSSIRALEDYSRTLGSFKSASPSGFKVNRCRPPAGRNERRL